MSRYRILAQMYTIAAQMRTLKPEFFSEKRKRSDFRPNECIFKTIEIFLSLLFSVFTVIVTLLKCIFVPGY